ncbi:MAG: hypothetical protein BZY88_12905 [SAR202 cluster bacterium Io17-Chloro-G9]|nr:MAG: hypothetical protein BZY88_12905 [SAR202 cluster bacterium Io17-Chloro-G9]
MIQRWLLTPKAMIFIPLALALAIMVACGGTGAEQEAADQGSAPESPTSAPASAVENTAVPAQPGASTTVAPVSTPEAASVGDVQPVGTLNVGLKEMGPFFLHPSTLGNPQIFVQGTAPIGEGLFQEDINHEVSGMLAESWSISEDFLTWTIKLNKGIQLHKGFGELTSEDVQWTMRQWGESKHPRAGQLASFWEDRPGSSTPDPYTVVVHTGEPFVKVIAQRWHMVPGGASTFIASKKQTDDLGVEAASEDMAATGPWEIQEHRTGEFWRMAAVRDHWRQTPAFDELIFWEIPEESSRIAGFQTGELDTFLMSMDTIPLVQEVVGAEVMSIPNAIEMRLRFYGNWYPIEGVEPRPGYDPELPWVSASPDVDSPEWAEARKVRQALVAAIDRDGLVETILSGYGHTRTVQGMYSGFEHYLDGRTLEFNPERATELLNEAGYPDGFSITLTPSLRGAPAEVESCEIIAQMWNDIGIDVNFQRIPYGTLRPQLVARTYQGATCHAGSPAPTPAQGYGSYLSKNPFNRGLEHPWQEAKMLEAMAEVNPAAREALEREIGAFLFDNALTDINYYTIDTVWPIGPRISPWLEKVRTSDVRQINGYEYIQHR